MGIQSAHYEPFAWWTIAALGKSLRGMETLDSFDCRRRNGITDAKISEHGRPLLRLCRARKCERSGEVRYNRLAQADARVFSS